MIDHLRGREKALEAFGWTGRRAEWIALACLHGGVFTRAQWTSFLGCHHEHVRRAVHALVAQGAAIEENGDYPLDAPRAQIYVPIWRERLCIRGGGLCVSNQGGG